MRAKMKKKFFPYGQKEIDYLRSQDCHLAKVIDSVGKIEREIKSGEDFFAVLVSSIIAQQISGMAALKIEQRLRTLLSGEISPSKVLLQSIDSLRACGLSLSKVSYIQSAAQSLVNKTVDSQKLDELADEEIINILTKLPGIGRWTAEMLLIFYFLRSDVISYGDFGIRRGMEILYGIEKITKKDFNHFSAKYHPYATIASFYLWYVANNNWQP